MDMSDAVFTLNYLFTGGAEPTCIDAGVANDDGAVDISDAVYGLGFLFLSGPAPNQPFPTCGLDPTSDEIECGTFESCTEAK